MRNRLPGPGAMNPAGEWTTVKTLLPYLWPAGETGLRIRVVVAMALLVAAKATNVSVPIFYKQAVDILTAKGNIDAMIGVPVALIVAYGLCRVGALAFGELRDAVFTRVAQRAIRRAGLQTFRHLHHLSLRFHLERKTGGVARAVERGTAGIEFLLRFMLFNVLPTLLEVLLVCGILWHLYGVAYAALTFGVLLVYIAWTLLVTEWRLKFRRAMNETDSEANTRAIDSLLNFETVKYFGNEDHEAARFDSALQRYETAAVKSGSSLALLNIGQGVIISVGVVAAMVMAGYGVRDGSMTVGDFVLVNSYLIQIFMPLNFLGFVYREIKRSLTDLEEMFELLGEPAEIADKPGARPLRDGPGRVEFKNVRFAYDDRRPILKDVSFELPAGKKLAIVGPSGSGKSTISRILYRFYDVGAGTVTIDGDDVADVTQKSLRAAIGIVPQDTVLFNDTIYYNIAYGRPGASPAEVEQAARQARIHEFIMSLPDGYQSMVGERGLKLSGGEKQRVAIARTILKDPRILVFDEATSALDSRTEQEILASFKDVSADRTTITIAHRLSTIIDADEIL
ncbi:MAG: ABC transporter ATP-binding protein/permease, partial [Rhodospirillales bacterium]|nr:ABC transporter ATP-binding protein/permease [Rhodospirillales bacterium]